MYPSVRIGATLRNIGTGQLTRGDTAQMCISSPWVEEVHIPQLKEILSLYDVDGFFLDGMLGKFTRGPCYCQYCKKAFGCRDSDFRSGPERFCAPSLADSEDESLCRESYRRRQKQTESRVCAEPCLGITQSGEAAGRGQTTCLGTGAALSRHS